MRLKQVFVLAPLLLFAAIAGAADTQLKEISVTAQGGATVVTLETAGPLVHSEYRPQPTMVLVDLQKVSSTALKQRQRSLDSPAVKGYRVLEYKSIGGVDVTRVELTVTDAAKLQVKETRNGLQLTFTEGASSAAAPAAPVHPVAEPAMAAKSPVPPATPAKPADADTPGSKTEAASPQPITIRKVGVVRTRTGVMVEIEGAKTAKTLRLNDPERLVVDIENALSPNKHQQTIAVNAPDLKAVRIAQYQMNPPVTRVVLDLAGPREFGLTNNGSKLVVTVFSPRAASGLDNASAPAGASDALVKQESNAASPTAHPVTASADQATITVVGEKPSAAHMNSAEPVAKQAAKVEVLPVTPTTAPASAAGDSAEKTATAPSMPAVEAMQSNSTGAAQAKLVPAAVSDTTAKPDGSLKNTDYVYVSPEYKKLDTASSSAAALPAGTHAVEAAATAAQNQPAPVLIAQAQPPKPATSEPAALPASTRSNEAATTVAQDQPPPPPAALDRPPKPVPAANLALEQQKASANPAPPPAKKYTGEPISVNLKDVDIKDFFRLIHEISGLNIVLDPNVRGTLTLVLDDVPWDQALDVVLHNNGLGRELEGNILRIAALDTFRKEAEAQRARTDAQALAVNKITVTRFLSYGRAKDIMPTIKKLLSTRGEVLADDRTNAVIINDIPSVIPNLDRLITQLDRKTMQVEIEARVVSATRNFAQQLGTQLGFAWGNGSTSIGGNPSNGIQHANLYVVVGNIPVLHQRWNHPAVLESGADRKYQRSGLLDRGWQLPGGRSAFRRRVARPGESPVPAAGGDAEQCHGGGAARLPNPDRDPEPARRSGDHNLHRRLSAADGHAADHDRKYDFPRG